MSLHPAPPSTTIDAPVRERWGRASRVGPWHRLDVVPTRSMPGTTACGRPLDPARWQESSPERVRPRLRCPDCRDAD